MYAILILSMIWLYYPHYLLPRVASRGKSSEAAESDYIIHVYNTPTQQPREATRMSTAPSHMIWLYYPHYLTFQQSTLVDLNTHVTQPQQANVHIATSRLNFFFHTVIDFTTYIT